MSFVLSEKKTMWLYSTADNQPPTVNKHPIAGSQGVFMPGAPCYVSTSGTVKLADDCDGTGDVYHGFITGTVDKSTTWPLTAELSSGAEVWVSKIDPNDYYCVYCSTGNETAGTDTYGATTLVGNTYGLVVSTVAATIGYTVMDINNSNGAVQVVAAMCDVEPEKYTSTTNPGVVLVKFRSAVVEAAKA